MIVTINTDASYSKQHKIGAFAFWIVCNDFKITRSGALRKQCHRPEVAEFRCIINAFHVLYTQDLSNVTKIIVNTDCLNVIHFCTKNKEAIRKYNLGIWGTQLVAKLEVITGSIKRKIPIEWRHVKSHVTTEGARNWVNDWCDKSAKQELRKALQCINQCVVDRFPFLNGKAE